MAKLNLKQRIGMILGGVSRLRGVWAAANDIHFIDAQTDIAPNQLESFDMSAVGRCAT